MQHLSKNLLLTCGVSVGLWLVSLIDVAWAHEKWFYDSAPHPTQWDAALRFPTIIGVGIALGVSALAAIWWRARGGRDLIPGPEILGATTDARGP
jgi:hypothetical protein